MSSNYCEYWFDLCEAIENNDQAQINTHLEAYKEEQEQMEAGSNYSDVEDQRYQQQQFHEEHGYYKVLDDE